MGRLKKYQLSREEMVKMLKLELEHEVNLILDKLDKTKDGYEFEEIAVNGFFGFNNKWMQAMAGIEPVNKNLKKLLTMVGTIVVHKESVLAKASRNFSITPMLQEQILRIGQEVVYSKASELDSGSKFH